MGSPATARAMLPGTERLKKTMRRSLSRASEIFERLTGGSMQRLCVDHEKNPPALFALRPGGSTVGIDGMSEGTRDQLYFALRLAALELHLEQTEPLPFIADDLLLRQSQGKLELSREDRHALDVMLRSSDDGAAEIFWSQVDGNALITEVPDLAPWQEAVKKVYDIVDLGPKKAEYIKKIGDVK